jgi:predicted DNA-binding transcriptional regulator AlpA
MTKKQSPQMPVNPFAMDDVIRCLSKLDPNYLLSRAEVARFLHISLQTLYRRCKEKRIDFVRIKRRIGFPVRVVLEYIEKSLANNALVAAK